MIVLQSQAMPILVHVESAHLPITSSVCVLLFILFSGLSFWCCWYSRQDLVILRGFCARYHCKPILSSCFIVISSSLDKQAKHYASTLSCSPKNETKENKNQTT